MSDQLNVVQTIVAHLVPHREQFETENFYGWRNCVFAALLFLGGVVTAHIALACGMITLFGFNGFAAASEVGEIKRKLEQQAKQIVASNNQTMAIVVGGQVFELSNRLCSARKAGNTDAEQSYRQQLQGTLETYERVSGREYRMQACP